MKQVPKTSLSRICAVLFAFLIMIGETESVRGGNSPNVWRILVGDELRRDEAVRVALDDLKETGEMYGVSFEVGSDEGPFVGNAILVGDPTRNRMTERLSAQGTIDITGEREGQGYQIITKPIDSGKVMVVAGGSVIGDVYGLYWIWDRIRVHKDLPDIDTLRNPRLKTRVSLSWGRHGSGGRTRETMRQALRYGINWVSGPATLDLVPWNSEPERTRNHENRQKTRELIEYAHSLHMKYYSFANEFTYHPSLLAEFNANLTPDDPRFWDAVQAKYRRLFQALPELDGVEICNDDLSGFWDDYRAFDLMHEPPECEWRLDKRFRVFVKKVHDVVVGEFDKTYFHFTWSLVAYEQHNQPDVFKAIFTEQIPTKNLYLVPKITSADRWWHQPYNPTFNLTDHNTIVGFEPMNYYEGGNTNIFPTFSGQYYQAGLQTFLLEPNTNLRGTGYLGGRLEGWDTRSVYSYVLYRLSWNPDEDIRTIAEDFCSVHFGPAAAEGMAEIYLLSPTAYKYGLHIEPVSYGRFNSFIHMRVGTFPAMGYPRIDHGKEHMEFLQRIYLRCKPWKTETFDDLDHGLATAVEMCDKFKSAESLIEDPGLAEKIENELTTTRRLIETNNLYVRTFFAYFEYREHPSAENKAALSRNYDRLMEVRERFVNTPNYGYHLFGVDQLLRNVERVLADREAAEKELRQAPTREELERAVARQQEIYRKVLEESADRAVKFAHFEAIVDGRDILAITGNRYRIEHLRWDSPHVRSHEFLQPLPKKEVTVVPRDIQSRPIHPFVLEQPTLENGYTTKIYLNDQPGGQGLMEFDLYYIPELPEELGLEAPWGK